MKIDLSPEEIWVLIGTLDGVWGEERSPAQVSAYDKLERAYQRHRRAVTSAMPDRGEG